MQQKLGKHSIVLLGVGHTNAHILKKWRMRPIPDARLICISNFPVATYSGMLPGVLAGSYQPEEMEIDLVRLCSVSNSRLVIGDVTGIDRDRKSIIFKDRAPIRYDVLSIGVGSIPSTRGVQIDADANVIRIKPMQTFLRRLDDRLKKLPGSDVTQISIVGAGIGGTEIAFCLVNRLKRDYPGRSFSVSLVNGSENLIGGCSKKTIEKVCQELKKKDIDVVTGKRVVKVDKHGLVFDDGSQRGTDIVFWATGASPPPVLDSIDLEKDETGFIATRSTLQAKNDDRIFAVGDSGTIVSDKTPKAGVFAVRQGPVLWKNIQALLNDKPLENYKPQRSFLKLINLGDGRAIAEYKSLSFSGGLAWKWKDRIDVKFMRMYQNYQPMAMKAPRDDQQAMRCVGCGGKISGASLESALGQLEFENNSQVLVGVDEPDDAAVLRTVDNQVTVTTDFFASPVNDPFMLGQIAALNGASDCYAMGSQPFAALAMAQVPFGAQKAQHQYLAEMMAGAAREFSKMKASIVGGHSIEGPRAALGFTVLANTPKFPLLKSGLNSGDDLVLTKPLGTGALLAALMVGKCNGHWFQSMVDSMLMHNQVALELCAKFKIAALTDVTGFGLAGHLLEMLHASEKDADLNLIAIPLLEGFSTLVDQNVESTMTIENKHIESQIQYNAKASERNAAYESLFDPQTCGGLLFSVNSKHTQSAIDLLKDEGFEDAVSIGTICDRVDGSSRINVLG